MKVEYLGHSCFKLTASTGVTVVCDPYSGEIGYGMPEIAPDAVTVSHHHFDHDCLDAIANSPAIFDKEGSFDVRGVKISSIKSFHDDAHGKKRGENLIFKFEMDGITVCHLGDLGEHCSDGLIEKISQVDLLLIPVGGNYTIDAKTAKQFADKVKPRILVPMHYRTADCKIDIDVVGEFLKLFDKNIISEVNCLNLTKDGLGDNDTKIAVMRRVYE